MKIELRKWRPSDARDLAAALSNRAVLNNLRDGLPYPYTEQDAAAYITAMLSSDANSTFAFAITVEKPEDVGDVLRRIRAIEQITVNDCRLSLESNCHMEVDLITPMTNGYADFVGELSEIPSVLSVRKMGGAEG